MKRRTPDDSATYNLLREHLEEVLNTLPRVKCVSCNFAMDF
jgi:hypothetical protein